jgi:hypothetical protein
MPALASNLNSNALTTPVQITGPCSVLVAGLRPGCKLTLLVSTATDGEFTLIGGPGTFTRGMPVLVDLVGTYWLRLRPEGLVATDDVDVTYLQ